MTAGMAYQLILKAALGPLELAMMDVGPPSPSHIFWGKSQHEDHDGTRVALAV